MDEKVLTIIEHKKEKYLFYDDSQNAIHLKIESNIGNLLITKGNKRATYLAWHNTP